VNYFIKTHSKNLPLEFDLLDYKPEEWTPVNSLMIVRMLGWELNLSWYSDYMFGEIVKKMGLDRARDFFPNYPEDAPFIIKSETKKESNEKNQKPGAENFHSVNDNYANVENRFKSIADLGNGFYFTTQNFRKYLGIEGSHIGSNAWVISGSKSENKKPILANDPHLALTVPSKWYEVQLYNEANEKYVSGFSIPGAPCIVIGQNNTIAWGITNLMNDDSEFYILDRDSTDRNKYIYKGNSFSLDSTSEEIKIKGVKEELSFVTYRTKAGPVISELETTSLYYNQNFKQKDNKILTFKWTGFELSDEIKSIYDINNSRNWNDFKSALKNFGLPASNFVYADTMGNIGYHAAGLVPIRKNLNSEYEVFYPSGGEVEWSGFINSDELPQSYNPKDSFIVTANNKPQKDYKFYISNLYEPPYRAERIEAILKSRNNFNANEFKLIQSDVYGLQAKEYCKYIFDAYKDTMSLYEEEKTFIKLLKNWDYNFSNFSVQASLMSEFELQLYKNLYLDKLGEDLFKSYLILNNIPVRNTSRILRDEKNWLFDFPGTPRKLETRDEMMKKTFREAIESLKTKFGTNDYTKWYWGEIHKVIMQHPFGIVSALSSIVNIGPYEIGGSGTTVANSEYSFIKALSSKEFESTLGQSMKYITDLSDTKNYYSVIPTGQSGQPIHQNYRDQNRLWLNGEYKIITTDLNELNTGNYKLLYLIPE
jgi:penicillin amidase